MAESPEVIDSKFGLGSNLYLRLWLFCETHHIFFLEKKRNRRRRKEVITPLDTPNDQVEDMIAEITQRQTLRLQRTSPVRCLEFIFFGFQIIKSFWTWNIFRGNKYFSLINKASISSFSAEMNEQHQDSTTYLDSWSCNCGKHSLSLSSSVNGWIFFHMWGRGMSSNGMLQ